ncbi:MAG: response regulator [Planctomycetota bacterium]
MAHACTVVFVAWAALAGQPFLAVALLVWRIGERARSWRRVTPPRVETDATRMPSSEPAGGVHDRMAAWSGTSAGVLLVDADGRVQWANAAAAGVLGRERLEGTAIHDLIPTLAHEDRARATAREHVAVAADGSFRPVAVHIDPHDPHHTDARQLLLVVDTTALRASERELLLQNNLLQSASMALFDAKVSAEEQNRRKTQFLAYASHEIRTPLQAILGFAEQLEDGALPEDEKAEAVRVIRRNGEHLLTVLSDVLDLARIESDHLELRLAPCNLRDEIADVVRLFAMTARERGVVIEIDEETPLPATIGTDKTRLRQVLINLLGNAVRCTRSLTKGMPARVRLALSAQASPPVIRIVVQDDGPGLPDSELQRMFEPFDQAAATADHRLGTGLGLAISRRLAQLLGGSLSATSAVGTGTSAVFTIDPGPLEPSEQWRRQERRGAETPRESPEKLRAHVLLAEDGRDNRLLIGTILKRAGVEVTAVEDGAGALAAVAAAQRAGNDFDAIVMDMQMPIMDGYEATSRLRADGCRLPILALTADGLADARQRCLDAGCDDYASKPIDRRGLVRTLERLLERDHRDREPSRPGEHESSLRLETAVATVRRT